MMSMRNLGRMAMVSVGGRRESRTVPNVRFEIERGVWGRHVEAESDR